MHERSESRGRAKRAKVDHGDEGREVDPARVNRFSWYNEINTDFLVQGVGNSESRGEIPQTFDAVEKDASGQMQTPDGGDVTMEEAHRNPLLPGDGQAMALDPAPASGDGPFGSADGPTGVGMQVELQLSIHLVRFSLLCYRCFKFQVTLYRNEVRVII